MPFVAFDLNGTLLDISALAEPLGGGEEARAIVARAYALTFEQAMALTLAGMTRPFPELVRAALEREAPGRDVDGAMERLAELPPFPDAAEALDLLREHGLRPVVLTNSAGSAAERALEAAGLRDRFELVLGADAVGAFKPDRRLYERLAFELDCAPEAIWFAAAHWWDLIGAAAVGMRPAWIARDGERLLSTAPRPAATGADLLAVAAAIVRDEEEAEPER
jgi:2-haloacid dehalogenase